MQQQMTRGFLSASAAIERLAVVVQVESEEQVRRRKHDTFEEWGHG